jgi:hypothetical protein
MGGWDDTVLTAEQHNALAIRPTTELLLLTFGKAGDDLVRRNNITIKQFAPEGVDGDGRRDALRVEVA